MDEIRYDAGLIQECAARVERAATRQMAAMTALGGLIGFAVGMGLSIPEFGSSLTLAALGLLVGATIGFLLGDARAESMRLASQVAPMCQVAIEENTRASSK